MKMSKWSVLATIASMFLMMIEPAWAVKFGEIGNNVGEASTGMANGVKSIGLLIGMALVVGGVVGFATHKKTNTPLSIPVIMIVAGVILSSLTAFVGSGSETIFGTDEQEWTEMNDGGF